MQTDKKLKRNTGCRQILIMKNTQGAVMRVNPMEKAMERTFHLTFFYSRFQKKQIDENGLAVCIFKYMLNSRDCEYGLFFKNNEDRADFLCWLYPRLLTSIRNYRKNGSTFDAYIATVIRYAYREYNYLNEGRDPVGSVYLECSARELEVHDTEEIYDSEEAPATPGILSPNQMLVILLKSYYFVTDALLRKAAPVIGLEVEALGAMVDNLHNLRLKKEAYAAKLTSSIHALYYRRISYEKQLEIKFEDKTLCASISTRIGRIRQRMEKMRKRLKAMRLEATNKEVADVLGIPKGTVDSRLAAIKNKIYPALTGQNPPANRFVDTR
jgi:hypothetical protein